MALPEIVFNDTCLTQQPAADNNIANSQFIEFVSAIGALVDEGICKATIRSQICLQDINIPIELSDTWRVDEWLSNSETDHDLRLFVLSLDTKVPIEEGLMLSSECEDSLVRYEYRAAKIDGPLCYAAGFTLNTGDVMISLPTDALWNTIRLGVFVCSGRNVLRKGEIDHISQESHVPQLKEAHKIRCFNSINCAAEFTEKKEIVFPNLRFSPDVDEQVRKIESIYLINALAKLSKMNETALHWSTDGTPEPDYRFQWSGESGPTMNDYGNERLFRTPEGGTAIYENHLYISKRHRIHFIEDRTRRDFIIGYIGDHLPTVKYPH